jgi:predicted regulator of Ras-like GTPase activity (Roadblock/LC7/MglB family)
MTEEHLDAKGIVRQISRLPGISSCLLMFTDGLPIAGNLPESFSEEAFSALVPRFFSRVDEASRDLALGNVESLTLHTKSGPLSFFVHGGVGMALLHSRSRFMPGVREKLVAIVRETSRIYAPTKL